MITSSSEQPGSANGAALTPCEDCHYAVAGACGESRFDRMAQLVGRIVDADRVVQLNNVDCDGADAECARYEAATHELTSAD